MNRHAHHHHQGATQPINAPSRKGGKRKNKQDRRSLLTKIDERMYMKLNESWPNLLVFYQIVTEHTIELASLFFGIVLICIGTILFITIGPRDCTHFKGRQLAFYKSCVLLNNTAKDFARGPWLCTDDSLINLLFLVDQKQYNNNAT